MSLATRCTSCGTVFRVVQDQLKVSEGWVRCGRCSEVFNALEGLLDLERDTPPDRRTEPPTSESSPLASDPDTDRLEIDEGSVPVEQPAMADKVEIAQARIPGSRRGEDRSTPATRVAERDRLEFPDAQFDPELPQDDAGEPGVAPSPDVSALALPPDASAQTEAPDFLRQEPGVAKWQSPRVRAALVAAAVVLLATFALQWGHQFRDLLAARWPAAKPVLQAWCGVMACSVEAPRRIEDVAVESSALTRTGADAFRLSVALRNRGMMTVTLPSVDLSLTDATGQLVARKVLTPPDFRVASTLLPAGSESALQLILTAGTARVTGYTVEIFYP